MTNFKTSELVPQEVYALLGENSRNLIDSRVIAAADRLRDWGGESLTVNTANKVYNYSGLRTPKSSDYSKTSQHSGNLGGDNKARALDLKPASKDVKKYHREILTNPERYPEISFIEVDITWLHIDSRPRTTNEVQVWSPKRGFIKAHRYLAELGTED